jgi:hypothetical protein
MTNTLKIQTEVLPGNKIEVDAPELSVGDRVDVTVVRTQPGAPRRSAVEVLDEIYARIPPGDPEEMDRRWREERDSWDD